MSASVNHYARSNKPSNADLALVSSRRNGFFFFFLGGGGRKLCAAKSSKICLYPLTYQKDTILYISTSVISNIKRAISISRFIAIHIFITFDFYTLKFLGWLLAAPPPCSYGHEVGLVHLALPKFAYRLYVDLTKCKKKHAVMKYIVGHCEYVTHSV